MRTYEFRRYDSKGRQTAAETKTFGCIKEAENYGYLQNYHEVIIKSNAKTR